jgi:hypothetical protein
VSARTRVSLSGAVFALALGIAGPAAAATVVDPGQTIAAPGSAHVLLASGKDTAAKAGGRGGVVVAGVTVIDPTQEAFGIALAFAIGLGLVVAVRAGQAKDASHRKPPRA